ncbi:DUF1918 domain-containing protein [Kitasatospora aureofaciens]|uniref:DUF1918 domain-containing protein n=1 Tax=Kitasatospora aureofaciens TaxID=1894 RepID=UPI001F202DD4|nr:DUF1918 domain-containing protein [Kitasatospora aureofaciens]
MHHADGSPPYDVRWSGTGHVAVLIPGPDAHVRHCPHPETGAMDRTDSRTAEFDRWSPYCSASKRLHATPATSCPRAGTLMGRPSSCPSVNIHT